MRRWTKAGLIAIGFGLVLMLTSGFFAWPRIVEHEQVAGLEQVSMGPYDPDGYTWAIWVEDRYPGFDEVEPMFLTSASDGPEGENVIMGEFARTYQTKEIDGTECELMQTFSDLDLETAYFIVSCADSSEEPADVYLMRSGSTYQWTLFAIGSAFLAVGAMLVLLVWWSARKREISISQEDPEDPSINESSDGLSKETG